MMELDDRWLVGRLRDLADAHPDRALYVELADGEQESGQLTAGDLARRATEVSARLADAGAKPGDRAIVFDVRGLDTLVATMGCFAAGVSPIILPPARRPEHVASRLLPVTRDAKPAALLTPRPEDERDQAVLDELLMGAQRLIPLDEIAGIDAALPDQPLHERAFVQYTSGSTAAPRGVMISHRSLALNLEMARVALGWSAGDSVIVTWNPLSHDMGLILGSLPGVAFGIPVKIMPPAAFILRPVRWLRAIAEYGGTHSFAPNFAFELCIGRVKEHEREGLDLSTWRAAINGAEPVRDETRRRFLEVYATCGFRPEAWCPAYGLAEATVMVSINSPEELSKSATVDRRALETGRVVPVEGDGEEAASVVACGELGEGLQAVIVDPETRRRLSADEVGEIWLRGPSISTGYFKRPDETNAIYGASLEGEDEGGFLRTGDIGFLRGNQVHIVGRAKDVLIVHGRNIHAADVELAVQRAHPAVRPGGIAAFAVDTSDRERIVVVVEVRGEPDRTEVARAVRDQVFTLLEVPVDDVVLTGPQGVPKTTSGKVQRSECRRQHLAGELPPPGDRAAVPG